MKALSVLAALVVAVLLSYAMGVGAQTSYTTWLPLHVPAQGEAWHARPPGTGPAMRIDYWKQTNQVTFKLCGLFYGTGSVLLSYAEAGDEVFFEHPVPRPLCIETETGYGGGARPVPIAIYIIERGHAKGPVGVDVPTLFVDSR